MTDGPLFSCYFCTGAAKAPNKWNKIILISFCVPKALLTLCFFVTITTVTFCLYKWLCRCSKNGLLGIKHCGLQDLKLPMRTVGQGLREAERRCLLKAKMKIKMFPCAVGRRIETWDKIPKVHNFIFYLPYRPSSKSLLSRRRESLRTEVGLLQPGSVGEMAAIQKVKYL